MKLEKSERAVVLYSVVEENTLSDRIPESQTRIRTSFFLLEELQAIRGSQKRVQRFAVMFWNKQLPKGLGFGYVFRTSGGLVAKDSDTQVNLPVK